jgi:hypothetical protein
MRLTLRTLLAWLDDTLPPAQVREIGIQVSQSPLAQELVERIHRVTRQRRLTVPPRQGPEATDPNLVASYLDNDLDAEQVAEYERKCLTSDVNLAEAASVHQILSLLGQKVHVPPEAKARMYQLVKGRETIPPPQRDGTGESRPAPVTQPIQPWVAPEPPRRGWLERLAPLLATLTLLAVLSWSAYHSLGPATPMEELVAAIQETDLTAGLPGDRQRPGGGPIPDPFRVGGGADLRLPREPLGTKEDADEATATTLSTPDLPAQPLPPIPAGAAGVVLQTDGPLLRSNEATREWEAVEASSPVNASDRLLCLKPFRARILLNQTPLALIGETLIRLSAGNGGEIPTLELKRGRLVIEPAAASGTLRLQASGTTLLIEHKSLKPIGISYEPRWEPGRLTSVVPVVVSALGGEVTVRLEGARETLSDGGRIVADLQARTLSRRGGSLPSWLEETEVSAEEAKLRDIFRAQFAPGRPVLADLVAATEHESPDIRILAVQAVKAVGDLSLLTPILARAGDAPARQAAAASLRQYLVENPEGQKALREELSHEFEGETSALVEQLLIGFSSEQASQEETLELLVNQLSPQTPSLVVRELALENLRTLTGRDDLGYDPEAPDGQGLERWRSLLKDPPLPQGIRKKAQR